MSAVVKRIDCSSKTNIPNGKHCLLFNKAVTTHCKINDRTKFHMVKSIDNAFDHMELCFAYKQKNLISENWLVLPRNISHSRIPR